MIRMYMPLACQVQNHRHQEKEKCTATPQQLQDIVLTK